MPPLEDFSEQEFEDAILRSFGVTTIRLKKPEDLGDQVAAILKHLYLSLDEVEEEHWSQAREGWCKKGMAEAQ